MSLKLSSSFFIIVVNFLSGEYFKNNLNKFAKLFYLLYIKVQSRVKKIKFDYLDQYNNSLWHLFFVVEMVYITFIFKMLA